MLLLALLYGCADWFTPSQRDTVVDSADQGACAALELEAEGSVDFRELSVGGLGLWPDIDRICTDAKGSTLSLLLDLDGEPMELWIELEGEGSYNLPDGTDLRLDYAGSSWSEDDFYLGTATLTVAANTGLGSLSGEATNADGEQLTLDLSWNRPVLPF